jgi:hypothetical protein
MKPIRAAILASLILTSTLLGARAAAAADFPPITDEERALAAVPGAPNAPAVVLFKKGEFLMAGYGLTTAVEVKAAERSLVYTRRVDVTSRALETSQQYEAIRSLFGDVEKSDAQALVLAKR